MVLLVIRCFVPRPAKAKDTEQPYSRYQRTEQLFASLHVSAAPCSFALFADSGGVSGLPTI